MSLTVPVTLMEKAQHGAVSDEEFVDCIRESLPYAWSMIERLAKDLDSTGASSVQNLEVPPDDASWGELFRLVASDAMRGAVERRFGVRMAFQNCCKVGLSGSTRQRNMRRSSHLARSFSTKILRW